MKQLVSIIIPVYNRQDHVLGTLNNILSNHYRPIELILVNDGSMDKSLDVLKKFRDFSATDDFVISVLSQKNKGAPAARNLGYSSSNGNFIQFLDSDDLIDQSKLEVQIKLLSDQGADMIVSDFEMYYEDEGKRVYHSNKGKIYKVLNANSSFGCGSSLLTRTVADKISWNESLKRNQDVDYFLKAALVAEKIIYVPQPLYTYIRHSGDRISGSYANTNSVYGERAKSLLQMTYGKFTFVWFVAFLSLQINVMRIRVLKVFKK